MNNCCISCSNPMMPIGNWCAGVICQECADLLSRKVDNSLAKLIREAAKRSIFDSDKLGPMLKIAGKLESGEPIFNEEIPA